MTYGGEPSAFCKPMTTPTRLASPSGISRSPTWALIVSLLRMACATATPLAGPYSSARLLTHSLARLTIPGSEPKVLGIGSSGPGADGHQPGGGTNGLPRMAYCPWEQGTR
jgi:hypothetical protein